MAKYHQGIYKPKNPEKYRGNLSNIIYRSSWERQFFLWCDNNPSILEWGSEEIVIPYISPIDSRAHRYFVDAKIKVKTNQGLVKTYLVEIKPDAQTRPPTGTKKTKRLIQEMMTYGVNEAKWKAANRYAQDRGWEFILITEHDLFGKK